MTDALDTSPRYPGSTLQASPHATAHSARGLVATASPWASQAARDVLAQGGSEGEARRKADAAAAHIRVKAGN